MKLRIMNVQIFFPMLALNYDNWVIIFQNAVIYFFTFLNSKISDKLRNNFVRIENIVTKRSNKGHNKSHFCRFLGLDTFFHTGNFLAQSFYQRSEERRVGKEYRSRLWDDYLMEKT